MRRNSFLAAFAAVAVAAPLAAQPTWQTIGVPSNANSGAYWNNRSDDTPTGGTVVCNAGNILTNSVAPSTAGCLNQIPSGVLPLSSPLTQQNVFLGGTAGSMPGSFRFTCNFSGGCLVRGLARVEGVPTTWGTLTDAGVATVGSSVIANGTTFSVWLTQSFSTPGVGDIYTTAMQRFTGAPGAIAAANTTNQQFTVFTNATGVGSGFLSQDAFGTRIAIGAGSTYWVTGEDNTCGGRGFTPVAGCQPTSDRDYNDLFLSITTVPEPSTYALMGTGLLALAGFAKRRKA
jgi:hypothetical protein